VCSSGGPVHVFILRVCCSVLQCVAVCCSVLQCVAVFCSVLKCAADMYICRYVYISGLEECDVELYY